MEMKIFGETIDLGRCTDCSREILFRTEQYFVGTPVITLSCHCENSETFVGNDDDEWPALVETLKKYIADWRKWRGFDPEHPAYACQHCGWSPEYFDLLHHTYIKCPNDECFHAPTIYDPNIAERRRRWNDANTTWERSAHTHLFSDELIGSRYSLRQIGKMFAWSLPNPIRQKALEAYEAAEKRKWDKALEEAAKAVSEQETFPTPDSGKKVIVDLPETEKLHRTEKMKGFEFGWEAWLESINGTPTMERVKKALDAVEAGDKIHADLPRNFGDPQAEIVSDDEFEVEDIPPPKKIVINGVEIKIDPSTKVETFGKTVKQVLLDTGFEETTDKPAMHAPAPQSRVVFFDDPHADKPGLEPCPFCGDQPCLSFKTETFLGENGEAEPDTETEVTLECMNPDCPGEEVRVTGADLDQAVTWWNTRAPKPSQEDNDGTEY